MFVIGGTTVQYNVSDSSGNFNDRCSFTVTVEDQENPEIVDCPMNITVNTTNGEPVAINVTWTEPTATDNSGETPEPESDYTSGDNMFVIGGTTVQYNVSDSSGNFNDRCSFTVTVEDNEPPVITCPTNITSNNFIAESNGVIYVNTDEGSPNSTVTWDQPVTSDNSNENVTVSSPYQSGDMIPVGNSPIEIVFTATDSYGNAYTCVFPIQVRDNEPPVPSCPSLITGVTDEGKPNGTVSYNLTVTDNVQVAMFSTNYTDIDPDRMTIDAAYDVTVTTGVFPIGETIVEYIFTDIRSPKGNEATCYVKIKIEDNNECDSNPCQNGGTCEDTVNGYRCARSLEWNGKNCTADAYDCQNIQYLNGSSVNDTMPFTFSNGFKGICCKQSVYDCDYIKCLNDTFCKMSNFTTQRCYCPDGISAIGSQCNLSVYDCEQIHCLNDGVCHYSNQYDTYRYRCECTEGFNSSNCNNESSRYTTDATATTETTVLTDDSNGTEYGGTHKTDALKSMSYMYTTRVTQSHIQRLAENVGRLGINISESDTISVLNSTMNLMSVGSLTHSEVDTTIDILNSLLQVSAVSSNTTINLFLSTCDDLLAEENIKTIVHSRDSDSSATSSKLLLLLETFAIDVIKSIAENGSEKDTYREISYKRENIVIIGQVIAGDSTTTSTNISIDNTLIQVVVPTSSFYGMTVAVVTKTLYKAMPNQLGGSERDNSSRLLPSIVSISIPTAGFPENTLFDHNDTMSLSITHMEIMEEDTQPICVFWKLLDNSTGGGWSDDGCEVVTYNNTHIVCQCTHLTNFAILMKVNENQPSLSDVHIVALDVLTYLLTSMSIICLLLTVLTYVYLRKWRIKRNIIHMNLAASLGTAQLLFLTLIDLTGNKNWCSYIALVLQYFFTVSFAWMLLEGVYLLVTSHSKLHHKNPRTGVYIAFGWVTPLCIVVISFCIGSSGYGTSDACWLKSGTAVIWAFVVPILIVIIFNSCVLVVVIRIFLGLKANENKTKRQQLRSSIRAVLLMLPLLGLTWAFGFATSYDNTNFFTYLFVIFNSSQGIYIFLQLIVLNSEINQIFIQRYKRRSSKTDVIVLTSTSPVIAREAFVEQSRSL
ncbi:adhesion G protein-coupled receptor L4-like [Anneissia japonica]|uniref:adhesion G protein-coupled receptor L4-like n=1 Tax=Anneissia japonica TaxID=1529436 RepID=UPI001425BAC6|nr:adhesion G protein-coupled receptor L4-like [Anneissia japonica]